MNKPDPIVILMADDDDDDKLLASEALTDWRVINTFHTVEDGVDLLEYLRGTGRYENAATPRPHLILLDLNMPRKSGWEALEEIKADPDLSRIPVVVLTTSSAHRDVERIYELGAASYIQKPVTFQGMVDIMSALDRYWFQIVELPPG